MKNKKKAKLFQRESTIMLQLIMHFENFTKCLNKNIHNKKYFTIYYYKYKNTKTKSNF